jgi:hypothetical protein
MFLAKTVLPAPMKVIFVMSAFFLMACGSTLLKSPR